MYPEFDFNYEAVPVGDGMGIVAAAVIIWLFFMVLMLAYSVLVYVLQSLGMYTIAKRRGIHHPWLSWLPIGNVWILGSISDQYQYVAKGKIRNRRKVLLGMNIAVCAAVVLYYIYWLASVIGLLIAGDQMVEMAPHSLSMVLPVIGFVLLIAAFSIVYTVFMYMAYYDLFESCKPSQAVVFLVLSIFLSFLLPFFVFACRKKDLGMPPRRSSVPTPQWQPAPPPVVPEGPSAAAEPEAPAVQPEAPAEDPEE